MTTAEAFAELLKLRAFFPVNKIGDETLTLYAGEMLDFAAADLRAGCAAAARGADWFPPLARIRECSIAARGARVEAERRIRELESRAGALRAELAKGAPGGSVITSEPRNARVLDRIETCGLSLFRVASVGDMIVPQDLADDQRAEWNRLARDAWRTRREALLREIDEQLKRATPRPSSAPAFASGTPIQPTRRLASGPVQISKLK